MALLNGDKPGTFQCPEAPVLYLVADVELLQQTIGKNDGFVFTKPAKIPEHNARLKSLPRQSRYFLQPCNWNWSFEKIVVSLLF